MSTKEPNFNHRITSDPIRLIDSQGAMMGVVPLKQALQLAEEAGLDLVEVSPDAKPPVCKILDYGKFRYEAQKRAKEARKKQKVITLKEIKLRVNIGDHDYDVKMRSARQFIEGGDKVKFSLRFRGREAEHQDLGYDMLRRVVADMADITKVETSPRSEGRQLITILVPQS